MILSFSASSVVYCLVEIPLQLHTIIFPPHRHYSSSKYNSQDVGREIGEVKLAV